jgi:hypothetical protein
MPRKRKTQPGPGGAYPNRTDLTQPVRTPTGQAYGEAQALQQAQSQQPLPQQPGIEQVLAAAQGHNFQPVGLNAPTQRPFEPITQGLPMGPGAGPEVLRRNAPRQSEKLRQLAAQTGDNSIADMASRLEKYGL